MVPTIFASAATPGHAIDPQTIIGPPPNLTVG